MEVFVDYTDRFIEVLKPASKALKDYLLEQNIRLSKGYRTEINLQAMEWITEIASALKKGFVLTIDYGYSASELYQDRRNSGTLVCYNNHKISTDPYCNIGKQDITTHVNFSALNNSGLKNGLDCAGFTNQSYFLRSLGLMNHLREIEKSATDKNPDKEKLGQLQTLLTSMGNNFKVLIQQKGLKTQALSGMQFPLRLV